MGEPFLDRDPAPDFERLVRLEQQLTNGYISPAEFAEGATTECALMDLPGMARYCERLDTRLLLLVRDRSAALLADPGGRLGSIGFVQQRATPEQVSALVQWLGARYQQLHEISLRVAGRLGQHAEQTAAGDGLPRSRDGRT